jgi:hypothetical protein
LYYFIFNEIQVPKNTYSIFYLFIILVAPYTQEEMQILNIPLDKRDYCAHYFRAIMLCTQQYWPSQYGYCEPERHAWEQCEIKRLVKI